MKGFGILMVVFIAGMSVSSLSFGQSKSQSDSLSSKTKVVPKFSEMVDYGLPSTVVMNQDGKINVVKREIVTIPSEKNQQKDLGKEKQSKKQKPLR